MASPESQKMLFFLLFTIFAIWIVFFGGADLIAGTLVSAFAVDFMAPFLTPALLKAYVVFIWIGRLAVLVLSRSAS